ncbi:hypothetical protein SEVIR_4G288132v4 [Setaria viridis]
MYSPENRGCPCTEGAPWTTEGVGRKAKLPLGRRWKQSKLRGNRRRGSSARLNKACARIQAKRHLLAFTSAGGRDRFILLSSRGQDGLVDRHMGGRGGPSRHVPAARAPIGRWMGGWIGRLGPAVACRLNQLPPFRDPACCCGITVHRSPFRVLSCTDWWQAHGRPSPSQGIMH